MGYLAVDGDVNITGGKWTVYGGDSSYYISGVYASGSITIDDGADLWIDLGETAIENILGGTLMAAEDGIIVKNDGGRIGIDEIDVYSTTLDPLYYEGFKVGIADRDATGKLIVGNEEVVIYGIIRPDGYSTYDRIVDQWGDRYGTINKWNGSEYYDAVLEGDIGNITMLEEYALTDYMERAFALGGKNGYKAIGQKYGEYGAYALDSTKEANENFWKLIKDHQNYHMNDFLTLGADGFSKAMTASDDAFASRAFTDCGPNKTHVWAAGFGDWAKLDSKRNINGYDYDGYGVVIGADRQVGRFGFGFAGAYTRGKLKVKGLSAEYETDQMNLALYTGYYHESGLFVKGGVGYAHGWNDIDVNMVLGGRAKGSFDTQAYSANLELGYAWKTSSCFNIIPSVGAEYTHYRNDGWREKVSGMDPTLANAFAKRNYDAFDIPVGLRVNRVWRLDGDSYIAPEIYGAWIYSAGNSPRSRIKTGFAGISKPAYNVYGVEVNRSRGVVGGGLKAKLGRSFDLSVDYNYEFSKNYDNHSVNATFGVSF